MSNYVFEAFNNGYLKLPDNSISFADIEWTKHPTFEGVWLKHIITAKDTNGEYSYHLVKIEPNMSIKKHIHKDQIETHEVIVGYGKCINAGTSLTYEPGVISIMSANVEHEVNAGSDGLFIFAKFFPSLC